MVTVAEMTTGVVRGLPVLQPRVVSRIIGASGRPVLTNRPPVRRYSHRSSGATTCLIAQTPARIPPDRPSVRDNPRHGPLIDRSDPMACSDVSGET